MNSYEIILNISLLVSSGLLHFLALNLNIYQSYYIIISYYVTLATKDYRLLYTQLQVSDVFWCTSKPNFEILPHRVTNEYVCVNILQIFSRSISKLGFGTHTTTSLRTL